MKWFQHQANSSLDAKLQEVLLDYGLEGYGLYWYCLELVSMNVEATNLTFELEHDCRIIARNTGSTPQKVTEMMTSFVKLGLFDQADGIITCLSLMKKCDEYTNKLLKTKVSGQCRDKVRSNRIEEKKVKDSTVEDRTIENSIKPLVATAPVEQKKRFIPPLATEVYDYMIEKQLTIEQANEQSDRFCDFYGSKGWLVGRNKMKNWKMAVNNWIRSNKPVNNTTESKPGWSAGTFDPNFLES